MDERRHRVGRNEALFREVNEQIDSLSRDMGPVDQMRIVCECADIACGNQLTVSVADYGRVRGDATCFFVTPGHERTDVESVVEQDDGYYVVRKREGEAARVAREMDPRSD